jgi:hypothetical protein
MTKYPNADSERPSLPEIETYSTLVIKASGFSESTLFDRDLG